MLRQVFLAALALMAASAFAPTSRVRVPVRPLASNKISIEATASLPAHLATNTTGTISDWAQDVCSLVLDEHGEYDDEALERCRDVAILSFVTSHTSELDDEDSY